MTLAASTRYKLYQPTVSTSEFLVVFPLFSTEDISVFVDGVETVDFSITATFVDGRSTDAEVVLDDPVVDVDVELYGTRTPRREDNYLGNSPNLALNLQRDADKLTAQQQELARDYGSTIRVSPRSPVVTPMLASAAERTNRAIVFGPDGLGIIPGPTIDEISASQGYAEAAEASAQAAAAYAPYPSRAVAISANVPAAVRKISVIHAGMVLDYVDDTSGTAITTNSGARAWSPDGLYTPKHYGAVGDNVADDTAAMDAAVSEGGFVYLPDGNYYVTKAYNSASMFGPGRLWLNGTELLGVPLRIGVNDPGGVGSAGGIVIGGMGPNLAGEGMRIWTQHPAWMQVEPTRDGDECQFQLYGKGFAGIGEAQSGSDEIVVTYPGLPQPSAEKFEVGDRIGFGGTEYLIDTVTFASGVIQSFTVTTTGGGAVNFSSTFTDTWYHQYQYSEGICDTNGTAVTRTSGDYFNIGASVAGQSKIIIDGTSYAVSSVDSGLGITLSASAGVQSDVTFIQKDLALDKHMTLFRMQTLKGSHEEVFNIHQKIDGRWTVQTAFAGDGSYRPIEIKTGPDFDGGTIQEHIQVSRDGRIGFGRDFLTNGWPNDSKVTAFRNHPDAQSGTGTSKSILYTGVSNFNGTEGRRFEMGILNNFRGLFLQSYSSLTGTGTAATSINPEGGTVTVGTSGAPASGLSLWAAGGDTQLGDGTWNGGHLRLGGYHIWVDATGDLRIKGSAPTSDTDGTIIGTQS